MGVEYIEPKEFNEYLSKELDRDDIKSGRFLTLLTGIFTAILLSLAYFYNIQNSPNNIQNTPPYIIYYTLGGFLLFLLWSLALAIACSFDIDYFTGYDNRGKIIINHFFKIIIVFIGKYFVCPRDKKYFEKYNKIRGDRKKLRKKLSKKKTYINSELLTFYTLDNQWKDFLITNRWKLRRWSMYFFIAGILFILSYLLLISIFRFYSLESTITNIFFNIQYEFTIAVFVILFLYYMLLRVNKRIRKADSIIKTIYIKITRIINP